MGYLVRYDGVSFEVDDTTGRQLLDILGKKVEGLFQLCEQSFITIVPGISTAIEKL